MHVLWNKNCKDVENTFKTASTQAQRELNRNENERITISCVYL